jgi:hypothetical protein
MLVIIKEGDEDNRYEKVSDENNGWVQVGITCQEHHGSCDDKKYYAGQQRA